MKIKYVYFIVIVLLTITSCKDENVVSGEWLIPVDEVRYGGVDKDVIPSLSLPQFVPKDSIENIMDESDLIIGIKIGNSIKGYPHRILDYHEIVNDQLEGVNYALTYCPLTGTGICWNREINGTITTFGVSGLVYNANLIPFDRETDSYWSQMKSQSVSGELINTNAETFHLLETSWSNWKVLFPDAEVLHYKTGFQRDYTTYPYGVYKTNPGYMVFPVSPEDSRLLSKERVLGVKVNDQAKAYQFNNFELGGNIVIEDNLDGENYVVIGNFSKNFMVAFSNQLLDGSVMQFSTLNEGNLIMKDEENNKYNIWGEIVEGPRTGQQLKKIDAYMGYWLAWSSFYEGIEIY